MGDNPHQRLKCRHVKRLVCSKTLVKWMLIATRAARTTSLDGFRNKVSQCRLEVGERKVDSLATRLVVRLVRAKNRCQERDLIIDVVIEYQAWSRQPTDISSLAALHMVQQGLKLVLVGGGVGSGGQRLPLELDAILQQVG